MVASTANASETMLSDLLALNFWEVTNPGSLNLLKG